uniref:Uncharacterized protein n=1 Tax=Prymnesium polylepis TaxID=72548 RepID=A0A7S4ME69_9EUKA
MEPLRVWRYGVPAEHTVVHGKRDIRMLTPNEKKDFPGWHAISNEGAALLCLDAPTYGTDGMADIWHIASAQLALPMFDLYSQLKPSLLAQPSLLAPPLPPHSQSPPTGATMQLSFHALDGRCIARARFAASVRAAPFSPPEAAHRRVEVFRVSATPASAAPVRCESTELLPRAGIVCAVLWQHGALVCSAAAHFGGALGSIDALCSAGEAVYLDTSGATQREHLPTRIMTGAVKVSPATAAEESLTAGMELDSIPRSTPAQWELELQPSLSMELPRTEVPGVTFRSQACQPHWATALRQLMS